MLPLLALLALLHLTPHHAGLIVADIRSRLRPGAGRHRRANQLSHHAARPVRR
jgi:hypothetical protein